MFYSTLRIIKFSSTNIWRNFWLSFITTTTIVVTLVSVSLVWALQIGLKQIISSAEKRIDMSVYFYPSITDAQANSVITALRTIPDVQEIIFVTKEQALANYEKMAKDSPELLVPLSAIGQNPFGSVCGTVLSKYKSAPGDGMFGVIGPMRMDYEKCWGLVNAVKMDLQ